MAAEDVMQDLQRLQQSAPSGPPFANVVGPTPQPDGSDLYTFGLQAPGGSDLTIPVGRWRLKLVGEDGAGTPVIPMRAVFEGAGSPNDGDLRFLEIDLARLELIAHPDDLVPADLVIDPYTHLVPNTALGSVRLLGPSLIITLRGSGLEDVAARFGGANGGVDPRFPSVRFDPPHFIVGPSEGVIGIACGEVLLDLSEEIDPVNLPALTGDSGDGSFTGVILQELGLFIGNPDEVGTWSGMARVRDFVLRFDPLELTGAFEGELVHAVAPDDPQVEVEVTFQLDDGTRIAVTEVDPTVPPPTAPATTRRVRLVATPNWASVGFQVHWTLPTGTQLEDAQRVDQPDLGWVLVPPGAHEFTVEVTDHRVDPVTAQRTVIVQSPPATPTPPALEADLVASVVEPGGGSKSLHLFVPAVPTMPVDLALSVTGGTGNALSTTLTLPAGWLADQALTRTATRPAGGTFPAITWVLTTPTAVGAGVIEVSTTVGPDTVVRRIRAEVRTPTAPGAPELDLLAYTDWRSEPGPAAALAVAHDGLPYDAPVWTLSSVDAPADLLSAAAHDALFADGALGFGSESTVALANVGGLVKPELTGADRCYRLVADIPAVTPERPPSLVLYPDTEPATPRSEPRVRDLFAERASGVPVAETFTVAGGQPGTIRFAWDSDVIQPTAVVAKHEDAGTTAASLRAEQATGFAHLFRALLEVGDRVERIGLFASASIEGDDDHNQDLSERRLASVLGALASPSADLVAGIGALPAPHALTAAQVAEASARFAAIPAADRVTVAWGEMNATGDRRPFDRRVFAVLRLQEPPTVAGFRRRTYFLVRGGAPVAPASTPPKLPHPEQHPFRHSVFRSAHVEVQVRRNELIRLQIRLELDVERFDENDLDPGGSLNPSDGILTGFLELRRNPDPSASPRFAWELDLLADPNDADGLVAFVRGGTGDGVVEAFGGPMIALPAMAAAAGGRTGPGGLAVAIGIGAFLQHVVQVFDVQTLIWKGLRLRLQHGGSSASRFSIGLDYAVTYDIDVDLTPFGIPVRLETTTPIEMSFRNVGVEVTGEFDSVELFYDPSSGFAVDIADPGVFQLGEGLGRLLRVDRVSIGDASPLWLEVELGFALDVGVFSVDTLRIRLSLEGDTIFEPDAGGVVHLDENALDLDDLRVSINKLGVGVNVPGIIDGRGVLGIKEEAGGTTVEGELELAFPSVPVLRGLDGQMKLFVSDDLRALYLALGIDFAPGLPLGSTGIAIYGLHGLLGANMAPTDPQPLQWLRQPPVGVTDQAKWTPARGVWNFGAGATLGTVFDGGFAFNLVGTFLLQVPGPRFVLAANAMVLSPKPEIGTNVGALATVLLDFENDLIVVGIDFALAIRPILELHVPVEAYFNLADARDFHIRFGQWAPGSRRITLTVFDTFEAWGYLQIEGGGLDNGALALVGTCIGAGARIEIVWGVKGLLYLEAFAEAHAGIQFKPLYFEGLIRVGGEIHAGPFSIGARGELTAKVQADDPEFLVLRGEVCGSIDLWLTSITKCVDFELGDEDAVTPPPLHPLADAVAVDRMTGLAIAPQPDGSVIVPLDAVFQLAFTADITDARPVPGVSLLGDMSVLRNQVSGELFYEFDLTSIEVRQIGGAAIPGVDSAWAPYTIVAASPTPPQSQRTLRLLDWKPTAHPRQVDFGSAAQSSIAQLIEMLCDPITPPPRRCADFDAEPLGPAPGWLLSAGTLRPVHVTVGGGGLGTESQGSNGQLPPRVIGLPGFSYPDRTAERRCLHLGRPGKAEIASLKDALHLLGVGSDRDVLRTQVDDLLVHVENAGRGEPLPRTLADLRAAGMVVLQVPTLVAADITVATPANFHGDEGEIAVLDVDGTIIVGPQPLGTLPPVPGGSSPATHPEHVVRRLSFGAPSLLTPGVDPPGGRWIVLRPPAAPVVRKGGDDGSLLFEVCGITLADWREFRRHHENVHHTIKVLVEQSGLIAGTPAAMTKPLLVPGATYEVVGSLGWERFRSATADPSDTDGTSASEGGPFPILSRRFVADPEPPADLSRYVLDHEPLDGEQPQFVDESIVLRYASPVVDRIYAAHGKQLVIRAKSDANGHTLIQPTAAGAGVTFTPVGPAEIELFEALQAMGDRCLPGEWSGLFPLPVHAVIEPLLPNTNYTVAVFARPASEPGGITLDEWRTRLDRAFDLGVGTGVDNGAVYRFDVRTSRWRNLPAQMDAYRAAVVGDLIVDDPAAFAAALAAVPAGGTARSDVVADALCIAATGGPIAIPSAPTVSRLWVPDGAAWACVGLLVDGPEPVLRRRLVGVGEVEERVDIDVRRALSASLPFSAGQPVDRRIVVGTRGARVFIATGPLAGANSQALLVGVTDRGRSLTTGPPTVHTIGVTVGSEPGVLAEGIG